MEGNVGVAKSQSCNNHVITYYGISPADYKYKMNFSLNSMFDESEIHRSPRKKKSNSI